MFERRIDTVVNFSDESVTDPSLRAIYQDHSLSIALSAGKPSIVSKLLKTKKQLTLCKNEQRFNWTTATDHHQCRRYRR